MVQNAILGLRTAYVPALAMALALVSGSAHAAEDNVAEKQVTETAGTNPALGGYCPVHVIDAKKWLEGDAEQAVEFDGREYRFASAEDKETFLADPVKYLPAFRGDCIVTWRKTGKRVAGQLGLGLFYEGRLFLFATAAEREAFREQPGIFGTADLAYEGRSAIQLVEDGKTVRGSEQFVAVHHGFRYHFSTKDDRETFLASPDDFAVDRKELELASGEATVKVSGKSACAYCDYKVWPMLTEGELGLAIEAEDGTIYVVEHADTKYVDIYNDRFDGITLSLTGREIKREGKVVWVVPDSLVPGT